MKKQRSLLYLIAVVSLVVVAIITTAIINSVKNNRGADIRAKAGVTNTLKLTGTVSEINTIDGTVTVTDVQFSEESRSGPAKNYGTWTVIPPATFSLGSVSPGQSVMFVVDAASFNVLTKNVTAAQMSVR